MKRCLFFATGRSSFVQYDIELLEKNCSVKYQQFSPSSISKIITSIFKQFFFLLYYIPKADFSYIWFADYHSFLPIVFSKIFRKPVYLVLGGSDVQFIPEYGLGNIYGPLGVRRFCVLQSLKYASYLFPVDQCLIESTNFYVDQNGLKQGVQALIKGYKVNFKVVATGIEELWFTKAKKRQIISVAYIPTMDRYFKKGMDLFVQLATQMPRYQFILVGLQKKLLDQITVPKNLRIYPFLDKKKLRELYAESKVFCLFSISEGLPNVLLEAMASGCIPVVSNLDSCRNAIGKNGYILSKKNLSEAKGLCERALYSDIDSSSLSKTTIEKYNINHRAKFIQNLLRGDFK